MNKIIGNLVLSLFYKTENLHRLSIEISDKFKLSDSLTQPHFISRKDQSVLFSTKMRMLWVKHHLCEFQALTGHFLMWEWMVSDNLNLSTIQSYPNAYSYRPSIVSRLFEL